MGNNTTEALITPSLREALAALRSEWSNSKLAAKLGVSTSVVSQYLNIDDHGNLRPEGSKYPGDVESLEKRILDLLRNEARRKASGVDTVECPTSRELRSALEFVRKTNDVGAILAQAGQGKTRAIELYISSNPLSLSIHVRTWARDMGSVEGLLFDAVGRSGYNGYDKRASYVASKLRGSDRLIIVDDAHKLTRAALQYLFDLHDETMCPIALVGTYQLEDLIKDDAQRFSRTGLRWEIAPEDPSTLIRHMITQLCPGVGSELSQIADLCEQVAKAHGHFRSVHKQLKLTAELKTDKTTWATAFRKAHTLLIREYKLN